MVERLINMFKLEVSKVYEVEDSFSSTVYKCLLTNGQNIFLKIPYSKVKLNRELEAYRLLSESIPTPKLLNYWLGDENCVGALLLTELKGETLTSNTSSSIAFQVGQIHGKLHTIQPNENYPSLHINNVFQNWSQFVDAQFYNFAKDVKPVIDDRLYKLALEKFEKMKQELPSPDGPSFIHMDFRPGNIIINKNQISGIIDFETVRFGSTEVDFTKLYRDYLSLNENLYLAYKEGYDSIRPLIDLDLVLPFYRFTDSFNSLGWCKRRGLSENMNFFERNLEILKESVL